MANYKQRPGKPLPIKRWPNHFSRTPNHIGWCQTNNPTILIVVLHHAIESFWAVQQCLWMYVVKTVMLVSCSLYWCLKGRPHFKWPREMLLVMLMLIATLVYYKSVYIHLYILPFLSHIPVKDFANDFFAFRNLKIVLSNKLQLAVLWIKRSYVACQRLCHGKDARSMNFLSPGESSLGSCYRITISALECSCICCTQLFLSLSLHVKPISLFFIFLYLFNRNPYDIWDYPGCWKHEAWAKCQY